MDSELRQYLCDMAQRIKEHFDDRIRDVETNLLREFRKRSIEGLQRRPNPEL